ncbi:hypothetical protein KIPB_014345, partial [Kipferlia bialata]
WILSALYALSFGALVLAMAVFRHSDSPFQVVLTTFGYFFFSLMAGFLTTYTPAAALYGLVYAITRTADVAPWSLWSTILGSLLQ